MDNYKIDVTGNDLLSKGAGIIVVFNNERVYAFRFDSQTQKDIRDNFQEGNYCFTNKHLLKPRVYCAVLAGILLAIAEENITETRRFQLDICRDLYGQEQNIINILRQHVKHLHLFEDITADHYLFVRHPKKSLVQKSAQKIWNNDWEGIERVKIIDDDLHNLIAKPKCKRKRW